MKNNYISFFEGYDADGKLVFNGNGCATTEENVPAEEFLEQHSDMLLAAAQRKNSSVVRVVIVSLIKL